MPPRPSLPAPAALSGPVLLSEAADLGVSRHELSTSRWRRVAPGVRLHRSLDPLDPMLRIRAVLAWLPGWAALGGWAALHWHGARALDGRTGPAGATPRPILVHIGPDRHLRRRAGIVIDRGRLSDRDIVEVRGTRVASPAKAVFDEMCRGGAEEGVVVGDAALAVGLTGKDELHDYLARHAKVRGVPKARIAVPLLDGRSRSGPESRLRYVWVVEAGLPHPQVNRGVVDEYGYLAGIADLLDPEAALVGEYDGADHRALARHTADNVREEGFEALNLTVARATSIDLWPDRPRLVRRLQAARSRGLARDRSRDRFRLRLD